VGVLVDGKLVTTQLGSLDGKLVLPFDGVLVGSFDGRFVGSFDGKLVASFVGSLEGILDEKELEFEG